MNEKDILSCSDFSREFQKFCENCFVVVSTCSRDGATCTVCLNIE